MKNKIFELIDKLLVISGNTYTKSSMDKNINEIETHINNHIILIKSLKGNISKNSYIDKNAIECDNKEMDRLNSKIKNNKEDITNLKQAIDKLNERLPVLNDRLASSNENITLYKDLLQNTINKKYLANNKDDYTKIINVNEVKLKFWEEKVSTFIEEINKITKDIDTYNFRIDELSSEIEFSEDTIKIIKEKLLKEDNYFEYEVKENEEKRLNTLEFELNEFENKKLELLTTPFSLANEFKMHIDLKEYDNARMKLNELFSVIDLIPFSKLENKKELEVELIRLYKEYNELQRNGNNINNKNNIIRIKDIEDVINSNSKYANSIIDIINKLDEDTLKLSDTLSNNEFEEELDNSYIRDLNKLIGISLSLNDIHKSIKEYNDKLLNEKSKLNNQNNIIKDNISNKNGLDIIKDSINIIEGKLNSNISISEIKNEVYLLLSSLEFDIEKDTKNYLRVVEIIDLETTDNDFGNITIDDIIKLIGDN